MEKAWCISVDYQYPNTRAILQKLHCERYKVWCGVNVYDAFCITDRAQAIQSKVQLFDQYISGSLSISDPFIDIIENATKAFLGKACDSAAEVMRYAPTLSLAEVVARCNDLDEKTALDMKCIFSTGYMMSFLGKVATPPTRVVCKAYNPRRLRFIEKGIISMESMIQQHHFHSSNADEYYMWYELDNPFDLEMCVFDENLHLILGNDTTDLRNFDYYINHVHIGRELCAICSNGNSQAELIASLNTSFDGRPFVSFREDMISELYL